MKIKLPVTYEVCGTVEVEAETIEKAVEYFSNNIDDIELPDYPEYVDGSFQLSSDDIDLIKIINRMPR